MAFCINCGAEIENGLRFCPFCGTSQVDNSQDNPYQQNNYAQNDNYVNQQYQDTQNTGYAQGEYQHYQDNSYTNYTQQSQVTGVAYNNYSNYTQTQKNSGGNGAKIAIIISSVVLAIIVCTIAGFLIVTNLNNSPAPVVTTASTNQSDAITTTPELETNPITTPELTTVPITTPPVTTAVITIPSVYVPSGIVGPDQVYESSFYMRVANTNGHGLLLRTGPGTNYSKIQNLSDDTIVHVLGYNMYMSDWYYVEINGAYGWCCGYADNTIYLYTY